MKKYIFKGRNPSHTVRVRFTINGIDYSKNKDIFKRILANHGLRWKGTLENAVWGNESEQVRGIFERDEKRCVTVSATLEWTGDGKTPFFTEFEKWILQFNPKVSTEKDASVKPEPARDIIERELAFWDLTHKPDANHLKRTGRPAEWIIKDMQCWLENRKRLECELREKRGGK